VGELIVTGPGMMLGYYRNEAATAASFHGSWFRTGDLFRKDERGFFYMVGRAKDMVRRAGENIAAAEVEAVLRELPEVQEVAVIPVPDDMRDEEVKAYIVLRPGAYPEDLPLDRLFRHCADKLAPFKVPRYIEYRTDPLPKTASEKISKPALIAERQDLRATSWDRVEKRWR
jgi:crotonobetaine/carnitine-CoA ligase